MKKLVVLLLALCIVFTCFACSGKNDNNSGVGPGGTTGEDNSDPYAKLPEYNGRGSDFRICNRQGYTDDEVFCEDESSNEVRDIALTLRNNAIKDRYNVFITDVTYGGAQYEQINQVINEIYLEQELYELVMSYAYESAQLAVYGYALNWNELPYNDLSRSYWMNEINEKFSIKDVIYTAVGKMCVSTITNTYATFYNRTQGEMRDSNMTNEIFTAIRNKTWTYDYFLNLVKDVYNDVDDETGRTISDFYGYRGALDWSIDFFQYAWDIPMIENNVETGLSDVYMSEKLTQAADMIYDLYFETTGTYLADMGDNSTQFANGKALFMHNWIDCVFSKLATMEDVYTILPYPMFDENQEDYLSGVADNYSVLSIPKTVKDPDTVSLIVEALNIESEKTLYPAYRKDALQKKYVSDPDTVEMLEHVMDSANFDIAVMLHSELGMMTLLRNTIISGSKDIKSAYDEKADDIAYALEEIMRQFELYKNN